jgi:hypothetical protein
VKITKKNPLVDSSVVYLNESCRRNPVSELKFVKFEKMAPRGMPSLSLSLSLSLISVEKIFQTRGGVNDAQMYDVCSRCMCRYLIDAVLSENHKKKIPWWIPV